jgi:hypothetical protein
MQQARERRRDDAEVPDKFPVVPGEAQETPEGVRRVWRRPSRDGHNLVGVHSHAVGGDDVAKVRD